MSDFKVYGRSGNWSSVFMKPGVQLNRRKHDDADQEYFASLFENDKSYKKSDSFAQQEEIERPISDQESLKLVMSCLSHCFSDEKLEWRSLRSNYTKLAFPTPEAIGDDDRRLRVRIENTVLRGCELILCGTLKKLTVELVINNEEQFHLIKKLQTSFMQHLHQTLPHAQIKFSVRTAGV